MSKHESKKRKYFYLIIHTLLISLFFYAFVQFITTSRADFFSRRLWAYESTLVGMFYVLFVFLTIMTDESVKEAIKKPKEHMQYFKDVLIVFLVLMIFPWGTFLLISPADVLEGLGLNSLFFKVAGSVSLLAASFYIIPYHFYSKKISYYILILGAIIEMIGGLGLGVLFILGEVPWLVLGALPLHLYFSYFLWEESNRHEGVRKALFKLLGKKSG